ncbi:MAG: aldehyde dehydrogenase family protein [Saprospiraceae bacterium]
MNNNESFNSGDSFLELQKHFFENPYPAIQERIKGLKKLRSNIIRFREDIVEALRMDFSKPAFESDSSEILVCLREIHLAIKNIKYWAQNQNVDSDLLLLGSSSYIRYEPKGVVLIISPWNYPINLSLSPLISAYAAGNKIILKPSELTPYISIVIQKIIDESFERNEVIVIQGDGIVSAELSSLPFNHVFFTGSGFIAKKILQAASVNLTPVTLELGGKCPVIIDRNFDLQKAVKHIAFAKLLNAGQTCIAPDFVCLHQSHLDEFVYLWDQNLSRSYGDDILHNSDYCGIINKNHLTRLTNIYNASIEDGAIACNKFEVEYSKLKMKPVLLKNVLWDNSIMSEEIFGPLLPLIIYESIEDLCVELNKKDRPLNVYLFTNNSKLKEQVISKTRSGGITINQCLLNYIDHNLPFGGDHQSGMGRSQGVFGFKEFSHERSITQQSILPSTLQLFYPPYSKIKLLIKSLLLKIYSSL